MPPRALRVAPPAPIRGPITRHADPVTAVAIGPDGRLLATGDGGGGVHLADLEFGRETFTLRLDARIAALACTSGTVGALAGETLHLVHGFGGRVVGAVALGAPGVAVAASADGAWIGALALDGTVVVVRTATGREKGRARAPGATGLAFADGGGLWLAWAEGGEGRALPALTPDPQVSPTEPSPWAGDGAAALPHPSGEAEVRVDGLDVYVVAR